MQRGAETRFHFAHRGIFFERSGAPRRAPPPNAASPIVAPGSRPGGAPSTNSSLTTASAEIFRQRLREPARPAAACAPPWDRRAKRQRVAAVLDERAVGRELASGAADVEIADDASTTAPDRCATRGRRTHDGRDRGADGGARRPARSLAGACARSRPAGAAAAPPRRPRDETPACAPASSRSRCADRARTADRAGREWRSGSRAARLRPEWPPPAPSSSAGSNSSSPS